MIMFLMIGCNLNSESSKTEIQNSKSKNEKTDLDERNLKGNVVFVMEDESSYFFDSNGMLTRFFNYDKNSYYNEDNNYMDNKIINSLHTSLGDGNKSEQKITYNYDENQKLISSESVNLKGEKTETKYKYNEKSDIHEKSEFRNERLISTLKYYYTENNLDSQINILFLGNGSLNHKRIFKNGLLISEEAFSKSEDNSSEKWYNQEKEYNKNGDLIIFKSVKFPVFTLGTYSEVKETYEYAYDPNGNWIERKTFINGKIDKTNKRTIIYKGGDYSNYITKYDNIIAKISGGNTPSNNSDNSYSDNGENSNGYNNSTSSENSSTYKKDQDEKEQCSRCKGAGKCQECNKSFRITYYSKSYNGWVNRNETHLGLTPCSTCHGTGVIDKGWNYDVNPKQPKFEPCYISECINGWIPCRSCNPTGKGENLGQCKSCHGTGIKS